MGHGSVAPPVAPQRPAAGLGLNSWEPGQWVPQPCPTDMQFLFSGSTLPGSQVCGQFEPHCFLLLSSCRSCLGGGICVADACPCAPVFFATVLIYCLRFIELFPSTHTLHSNSDLLQVLSWCPPPATPPAIRSQIRNQIARERGRDVYIYYTLDVL